MDSYDSFKSGPAAKQWEKIGTQKRAGVATPLFSIYSKSSTGIGEIPDLKLLADWCKKCGMSIIQLLPLNDVGFKFTPYDSESTFAMDPMYLSLENLKNVKKTAFRTQIQKLKKIFSAGKDRVDYGIKKAKLELLWEMFKGAPEKTWKGFPEYCESQKFWLDEYAVYKVLKEKNNEAGWEHWPQAEKNKEPAMIKQIKKDNGCQVQFRKWLQWQLFEQFRDAKEYAQAHGVLLMGDLPFLVSRDSEDVWSHQDYFKLDLLAGAPPDLFFANGQRWGMPPYRWDKISENGYDYLKGKLRYAQNFYDFFRIDHAVGLFRIWTIPASEPPENAGLNGTFDPADESHWEEHGKKLLDVMLKSTAMLPCAEDLGVVPECSYRVLADYNLPGMDVQRWARDWGKTYDFKAPEAYRPNSMAVISTHDMSSLKAWWLYDADTVDSVLFERQCREHGIDFESIKSRLFDLEHSGHGRLRWNSDIKDTSALLGVLQKSEQDAWFFVDTFRGTSRERESFLRFLYPENERPSPSQIAADSHRFSEFAKKAIARANQSASVFSIQLLQDWLSCDPGFKGDAWEFRINVPGTMGDTNWTLTMPLSCEELLKSPLNGEIKTLNQNSARI